MEKELIIVTGSCGRIGSQVVKRLREKYLVVGFDVVKSTSGDGELISVDLSSDESVNHAFDLVKKRYGNKICSVIHLAAYYSFSEKHSEKYDEITVKGTERILKALQGFEVDQFLFTSTMLVHGATRPAITIKEEDPLAPSWDYPLSKVQTEKVIHKRRGNTSAVLLRVAGVYDDLCHSIPISNQIQRIYEKQLEAHFFPGNLSHGASFVHMDDLVDAIELAIQKRKELPKELPLLIGESKTLSYGYLQNAISLLIHNKPFRTIRIPKIVAKIGSAVKCALAFKKKPFIRPWMIAFADDHYELDISKAKHLLGWSPRRSLESTLPKMIQALKKDPLNWYKINGLFIPSSLERKLHNEGR